MRKVLVIAALCAALVGCGDDKLSLPIGVDLGSSVSDFKKKINVINEIDFPDTAPAKSIKFDSPPKPFAGYSVSYEAQTRNGNVIGVMIWSLGAGESVYEEKIKEASSSLGSSVASEIDVTNELLSKASAMQCAIDRSCPGDKYRLFVSDGFSALITLNNNDVSVLYSKDDEMNKSMGR
ncbi:hypothetical protein [uncultured Cedecea sp.]|uniref:hypothetical protein n=1 Tax=uncultured Cedecea sp. TaxID=988762 RepID=UPI00261E97FF|nr:hypothetical protein [uncultured Cedecea sp.]